MSERILVTGASVAGTALAWWLDRRGFAVTVVERAPAFRDGGQNVDVRGFGREVLRRMGLEQAALARGTGEQGMRLIDRKGRAVVSIAAGTEQQDGPTAEMEILRGDLARLLLDAAGPGVEYRFGDRITAIEQDADAAIVTFASGRSERFAIVIVAEGVGSATRELAFPGGNQPWPMHLAIAFFTIPRTASDEPFWRWFHAGKGRSLSLRPDRYGTTRASLVSWQPPNGEQSWSAEQQKAMLRERFAGAGWETPRALTAMADTTDFYFDVLRQVRMPRWSNGRVVLTGDAAWCVTPLGGRGSTLAIVGAYVLAGELARLGLGRAADAFARYERIMRPMVDQAQAVPRWVPRLFNPQTRLGVRLLHLGLAAATSRPVRALFARWPGKRSPDPVPPDYPSVPPASTQGVP